MTREEIEKLSVVGPYCFETDREERWYEIGCIDGLRAADAEPNLKSLWHDASEEPQYKNKRILAYSEYYDYPFAEFPNYLIVKDGGQNKNWEAAVLRNRITRYMDFTKRRKSLQLVLITTFGLSRSIYSNIVSKTLVLDDLFR